MVFGIPSKCKKTGTKKVVHWQKEVHHFTQNFMLIQNMWFVLKNSVHKKWIYRD